MFFLLNSVFFISFCKIFIFFLISPSRIYYPNHNFFLFLKNTPSLLVFIFNTKIFFEPAVKRWSRTSKLLNWVKKLAAIKADFREGEYEQSPKTYSHEFGSHENKDGRFRVCRAILCRDSTLIIKIKNQARLMRMSICLSIHSYEIQYQYYST